MRRCLLLLIVILACLLTMPGDVRAMGVAGAGVVGEALDLWIPSPAAPPADDECTGATPIHGGMNGPFSNVGYTDSNPAWPCGSAERDRWFVYVPSSSGEVAFETCGSQFDTVLEVFDGVGGCGALQSVGCNDDTCDLQASLTIHVTAQRPYFLRVGGWSGYTGDFVINVAPLLHLGNSSFRWGLPFEALGDYDGDGYDDFAVSDLEYGASNGGTVWIVSGRTLAVLSAQEGGIAFERFGQDMAGLDGKLIVGAPDRDAGTGPEGEIVELFYNPWGVSRRLLLRGGNIGLTHIGRRLAVSNYLNGDGARDLVFMAADPVTGQNTLIVACSANAGSPYREHWRYTAPYGVGALEIVGDMNGDGFDDVALGMASYNNSMGRVEVLSGRDGSLLNARDGSPQSEFGFAVQGLGDVDDDGRSEILVSAPSEIGGTIYAMSLDMRDRWHR
ncbi:MAG: FG-GAP repeat protein, partial [Planctomycetes bacterium]|nr:FG-GAP repeat protein [Planctomycetota bacterium]